eukprot:TRINITY_DN258_c0_g1_i1.p1 TRINITY_DN258_c0_g1~~TRINITY_DN258_c0_g1_i1.p1  ORF type:complete len:319 (+),score=26.86 TRINITY_DN258_c0_g1_i1:7-963(+)
MSYSATVHTLFEDNNIDNILDNNTGNEISFHHDSSFPLGPIDFNWPDTTNTDDSSYLLTLDPVEERTCDESEEPSTARQESCPMDVNSVDLLFSHNPAPVNNLCVPPTIQLPNTQPQFPFVPPLNQPQLGQMDQPPPPVQYKQPQYDTMFTTLNPSNFNNVDKNNTLNFGTLPEPSKISSLVDYRNDLITLESDTFEKYMNLVTKYRQLSQEEKREAKQILRRIKNRESARQSRRDKKDKLSDLEETVRQLRSQIGDLKTEVGNLRSENVSLRTDLDFSRNLISTDPRMTQLYQQNLPSQVSTRTSYHINAFLRLIII